MQSSPVSPAWLNGGLMSGHATLWVQCLLTMSAALPPDVMWFIARNPLAADPPTQWKLRIVWRLLILASGCFAQSIIASLSPKTQLTSPRFTPRCRSTHLKSTTCSMQVLAAENSAPNVAVSAEPCFLPWEWIGVLLSKCKNPVTAFSSTTSCMRFASKQWVNTNSSPDCSGASSRISSGSSWHTVRAQSCSLELSNEVMSGGSVLNLIFWWGKALRCPQMCLSLSRCPILEATQKLDTVITTVWTSYLPRLTAYCDWPIRLQHFSTSSSSSESEMSISGSSLGTGGVSFFLGNSPNISLKEPNGFQHIAWDPSKECDLYLCQIHNPDGRSKVLSNLVWNGRTPLSICRSIYLDHPQQKSRHSHRSRGICSALPLSIISWRSKAQPWIERTPVASRNQSTNLQIFFH